MFIVIPNDLDILLVAPGGQKILLMSDCGGGGDLINASLTFDDSAPALPNTATIIPGVFAPTNFGIADNLPSPAPTGPFPDPQMLSTFNSLFNSNTKSAPRTSGQEAPAASQ